ncbi:MAG: HlyC/CorC family transporter [Acidobacteria bacterium]|nr:HlyC/CorC family transporter [Acidobacteriota bacterium]MBV9478576.1 HlyC/CorC family transporter [Acidobacteriota bacterium]
MGSSIPHPHILWSLLAILCGIFYLVFDALRSFALQLSPVRLHRLSTSSEENGSRWMAFDVEDFQFVSGALLQVALVIGAGSTAMALSDRSFGVAIFTSVLIWCVVVFAWKYALALIPEDTGETMLRLLVPLSHVGYYLFWPFLYPLRRLLERLESAEENDDEEEEVTDEEVRAYIDVGEEAGVLEASEGRMLQSIVDFGDRLAHEIMTPRIDVLAFDARHPMDELAKLFSESKYSRIPIYGTSIDQITGIVHIKELFDAILRGETKPVAELAREPYFVSETKKVSELLREFQTEHLQIAIVVDEYGGTAGIVTTEDIVEEIVGEIADEHEDEEVTIVDVGDGNLLVNGLLRVEQLEEKLDADLSGDDYETVAGLIFTTLGRVPKVGAVVTKNGYRFEVERADRRRIYRVRVSKDPDWRRDEEEDEDV